MLYLNVSLQRDCLQRCQIGSCFNLQSCINSYLCIYVGNHILKLLTVCWYLPWEGVRGPGFWIQISIWMYSDSKRVGLGFRPFTCVGFISNPFLRFIFQAGRDSGFRFEIGGILDSYFSKEDPKIGQLY